MLNFYEHVQTSIISELNKYKPDGVTAITDTDTMNEQPDYPYIAVTIYTPEQKIGKSNKYPVRKVQVQILSVSDNKLKGLDLGHWIRNVFYLEQPLEDMAKKGVVPLETIQPVNFTRTFLPTHYEFINGGDFTFSVADPITDNTQGGYIDHIRGTANDCSLRADR